MMFSCLPPAGKCEWSHLKGFVDQFNAAYKKEYKWAECPDVVRRNEKEPDGLLKASGEPDIVLEHKSVSWPDRHFHDHGNAHIFSDTVPILLDGQFSDSVYKLIIYEKSLKGKKKKEINELGK